MKVWIPAASAFLEGVSQASQFAGKIVFRLGLEHSFYLFLYLFYVAMSEVSVRELK